MPISSLKGGNFEIWNEFGQVAYVTSGRDVPEFRTPEKGPRECDGKKIPAVKVSFPQSFLTQTFPFRMENFIPFLKVPKSQHSSHPPLIRT